MTANAQAIIFLALSFVPVIAFCALIEWRNAAARRARVACDRPRSRKHIRVTHRTFDVRIAYYDHGGRKVTQRIYPLARYYAILQSARAKGYAVC